MKLSDRFLIRAKVMEQKADYEVPEWKFGRLEVHEVQEGVLGLEIPVVDNSNYYLVQREPNSFMDWNLPYPNIRYIIPREYHNTVTPFIGYIDKNEENIFVGDILRFHNNHNQHGDMIVTYDGFYNSDKDYLPPIYFTGRAGVKVNHKLSNFMIIGNIWDGPRGNIKVDNWINGLTRHEIEELFA